MRKPAVATYQVPWEFDALINQFDRWPERVLEVGCYEGGTVWHWLQMARTVVAVDDLMRNGDEWDDWADEAGSRLYRLQGSSHDDWVVEAAHDLGPYDFIFIDADHTYDAVRADFKNYAPMLAEGGVIALHDILPRPGYGVSQLWGQIKDSGCARWMEICQNSVEPGNEGRCGIGIAWL